jgi:hypothetical protein
VGCSCSGQCAVLLCKVPGRQAIRCRQRHYNWCYLGQNHGVLQQPSVRRNHHIYPHQRWRLWRFQPGALRSVVYVVAVFFVGLSAVLLQLLQGSLGMLSTFCIMGWLGNHLLQHIRTLSLHNCSLHALDSCSHLCVSCHCCYCCCCCCVLPSNQPMITTKTGFVRATLTTGQFEATGNSECLPGGSCDC